MASSDTFNRADNASSMGNADTGETWENLKPTQTTWGIVSNTARCFDARDSGGVLAAWSVIDTGLADFRLDVDIVDQGSNPGDSGPSCGASWRFTDASNGWFVSAASPAGVFKREAGVNDQIGTSLSAVAETGDRITIICSGSSMKFYVNDVLIRETVHSFNATATKHGLFNEEYRGVGVALTNKYDNFSVVPLDDMHVGYVAMG